MPEDRTNPVSSLCSLRKTPLVMDAAMRQLLIEHFRTANNIEQPELRSRIFTPDLDTGILIELHSRFRPELAGKRPAITLRRAPWKQVKRTVAGGLSGTTEDGHRMRTTFRSGGHLFTAISKEASEAEILGAEVYNYFCDFGQVIRQWLGLLRFEVLALGEARPMIESRDHTAVVVPVEYHWAESWVERQLSTAITSFEVTDTIELG